VSSIASYAITMILLGLFQFVLILSINWVKC